MNTLFSAHVFAHASKQGFIKGWGKRLDVLRAAFAAMFFVASLFVASLFVTSLSVASVQAQSQSASGAQAISQAVSQAAAPIISPTVSPEQEQATVRAAIQQMFDGMKSGDTTRIRAVLDPSARLQTTGTKNGVAFVRTESVEEWLKNVATPRMGADGKRLMLDERLLRLDVSVDGVLASAWTPYQFWLGGTFSHCGTNAFHLWKSGAGWKILSITDTRRKDGCGQ
jgi:hypothetical protein